MQSATLKTLIVVASLVAFRVAACGSSQPRRPNEKKSALAHSVSTVQANSPLGFESNVGQFSSAAWYISRGKGYDLFLTPAEAVFNFKTPHPSNDPARGSGPASTPASPSPRGKRDPLCYSISSKSVRLRLILTASRAA
jgi:hypothetical protein